MVARPLATPVTSPAVVTVATAGASDNHPEVMGLVCPPESDSVPDACVVWPIRTGLDTVTVTPVVVDDGTVGDDESSPQAPTNARGRATSSRFIDTPLPMDNVHVAESERPLLSKV
jgi:hypothetical protein